MGQGRPAIRPVVDQQTFRRNHLGTHGFDPVWPIASYSGGDGVHKHLKTAALTGMLSLLSKPPLELVQHASHSSRDLQ